MNTKCADSKRPIAREISKALGQFLSNRPGYCNESGRFKLARLRLIRAFCDKESRLAFDPFNSCRWSGLTMARLVQSFG